MSGLDDLLQRAAREAAAYRASLPARRVISADDLDGARTAFAGPLADGPTPASEVIDTLVSAAEGGLVATAGPRYFGFVIGGSLDAATAADILTSGWDQNAFSAVMSPAAIAAEEAAGAWLKELLGIPETASVGFVTGAQGANTVGLAAGRHHVLAAAGWDVERQGLLGAPKVRIVANGERHASLDMSLRLLGLGTDVLEPVATDANGAIIPDDLAAVLAAGPAGPTIVCLQAGNVNTGAVDPLRASCEIAHERGAWVHVDGAFGLWAGASARLRPLVDGVEHADSWGCDGHKWLNVPYDSGFAFCAHPAAHFSAISYTASYLVGPGGVPVGGGDLVPESSRRARGFTAWAALPPARPAWRGRADRAQLRPGPALRRRAGRRRCRHRQRRGAEPGAGRVRRRRPHRRRHRRRPARGHVLDGRHHVARPPPDAHLGLQLVDHRRRRGPVRRRHPGSGGRGQIATVMATQLAKRDELAAWSVTVPRSSSVAGSG